MDDDLRNEWTDALRGGDYPQGVHALRSELGYCPWGVLCEIAVGRGYLEPHEWRLDPSNIMGERRIMAYKNTETGNVFSKYPDNDVLAWAGIPRDVGPSDDIVLRLASMNDNGTNFSYIAEEIEEYLGRPRA